MGLGDRARGGGWFARAQRLVEQDPDGRPDHGFLFIPEGLAAFYAGDGERAAAAFDRAAEFARRLPRRRPHRARRPRARPVEDHARRTGRGPGAARRGHGGRHRRRGLADPVGHRLLRDAAVVPAGVRRPARPGVDAGPRPLVRRAARHGGLHRAVPRASGGAVPAARRVGRCARRGGGGAGTCGARRPPRALGRLVRARRGPSTAGRLGGGGVVVRTRGGIGLRTGARSGAAPPGAGECHARAVAHPRRRRAPRSGGAARAPRGRGGDPARRRRRRPARVRPPRSSPR